MVKETPVKETLVKRVLVKKTVVEARPPRAFGTCCTPSSMAARSAASAASISASRAARSAASAARRCGRGETAGERKDTRPPLAYLTKARSKKLLGRRPVV